MVHDVSSSKGDETFSYFKIRVKTRRLPDVPVCVYARMYFYTLQGPSNTLLYIALQKHGGPR